MSHTKEPWRIRCHTCATPSDIREGDDYTIEGADGALVAFEPRNGDHSLGADARRVVACVNACEGIGTEYLERFGGTSFNDFKRVKEQRDALLESAKELADLLENALRIGAIAKDLILAESIRNVLPIHRAVIAKATGSQS